MTSITAQIHIDTTSSSSQPLPTSPIPFSNSTAELTPSTQLSIPIISPENAAEHAKPQQLSDLAEAVNTTRASLNQVLTAWKDWAGKEDGRAGAPTAADNDDEQEDDDDEEEE
ncbi:uncharacterized protein SPSC_03649 [Sporisorium scitamineum]|uniref:EKC/KEOPS complex subunit GON7 n=1 Tax=Sporisorium scitamineum TaxID=49012 RepID=A0A0F7RVR1_9BASI|nr:uncharacterized protein SPSC_03649 [Sporisorium scitamineum]CDR99179.1 hypothetical protein [Sporisorium scitamineum]